MLGLCYNNELFYQMAKGLIHPDVLEWVSNQSIFVCPIIAPSMQIKHIWRDDEDFKVYKNQIFTNLHETHSNGPQIHRLLEDFYN